MNRFYITTPIYYVNDEPHIGHAYTTILADVLAGYHRLLGDDTYFLTGTDEHGQKLPEAAKKNNMEPQAYCDLIVERFKAAWVKLNIKNDDFIRTTEQRHKSVVQKILTQIYDKGEIYAADYEGWYCVPDERFWTEKDLLDGNCPECKRPVVKLNEKNYFFKMSAYQDWLIDYINTHPKFIQPDFRRNEILGFLKQPLGDLCISRPKSRLSWGIELPFDKDYVCYVWFDALINYISAIGFTTDDAKFNHRWPAVHLIGKDILTTHAVYWPCMIKAIGIEPPVTIFAHGWWLAGDSKMSKSLGNVIKPFVLAEKYGTDPLRYFLIRDMALGQDSRYSDESFVIRYNSDLANDLGNLLSRVTKMIQSFCDSRIPEYPDGTASPDIDEIVTKVKNLDSGMRDKIESFKLNQFVEETLELVRATNRFVEHNKPWELAKNKQTDKLNQVLYAAAEVLRQVSILLSPIMPGKCAEIQRQIGIAQNSPEAKLLEWRALRPGTPIASGDSLFPRLVVEKLAEPDSTESKISYYDFAKIELKTARVLEAERVKGADKLLRLQIELGSEKRQIVAGIAQHYSPEQMIGKTIIVVVNLEPAKIRGVESNGMLLAAKSGDKLVLLTSDSDIPSGCKIS